MRDWRKEITAYQEAMESSPESKEPTSREIGSVAMYEEVPKEEAAVIPIIKLKKRHGDWNLAVGCRAMVGPGRSWPPSAEG
jgi:hypothetical protein